MGAQKILFIDDEEDIRTVARLGLENVGGFEVLLAASGEEGIEIAAAERPDAILLDVMMPGLDGPSTLRRLKEQDASADIPVIFLTAKVQRAEIQGLEELGPAGVLTKPFDPMKLSNQVLALLKD